jgi:hypothetical protein
MNITDKNPLGPVGHGYFPFRIRRSLGMSCLALDFTVIIRLMAMPSQVG